ncbi:hypothetical protein FA13DRAFT_1711570 [Coprinellus micaceus]|uniref:Uncharacterized protein n=1 Tax=Coprinellus micaceus TaxID=71717 RepID=A0A4Y7T427_COPMI|nr:hypothetical protein FA13DRAFT_1711570 [Coprinellus micaceus]
MTRKRKPVPRNDFDAQCFRICTYIVVDKPKNKIYSDRDSSDPGSLSTYPWVGSLVPMMDIQEQSEEEPSTPEFNVLSKVMPTPYQSLLNARTQGLRLGKDSELSSLEDEAAFPSKKKGKSGQKARALLLASVHMNAPAGPNRDPGYRGRSPTPASGWYALINQFGSMGLRFEMLREWGEEESSFGRISAIPKKLLPTGGEHLQERLLKTRPQQKGAASYRRCKTVGRHGMANVEVEVYNGSHLRTSKAMYSVRRRRASRPQGPRKTLRIGRAVKY